MTPALPVASGKAILKALEKAGFESYSQKGSHVKMKHPDGRIVIVPIHSELATGTLRSIIRQASLSIDEFTMLLKK